MKTDKPTLKMLTNKKKIGLLIGDDSVTLGGFHR